MILGHGLVSCSWLSQQECHAGTAAFWLQSSSPNASYACTSCFITPPTPVNTSTEVLTSSYIIRPPTAVQSAEVIQLSFHCSSFCPGAALAQRCHRCTLQRLRAKPSSIALATVPCQDQAAVVVSAGSEQHHTAVAAAASYQQRMMVDSARFASSVLQ